MTIKYDTLTLKWFKSHPFAQTTVTECARCKLYYKPILGHKCKKTDKQRRTTNDAR